MCYVVYRSATEGSERPVQDRVSPGGGEIRLGVETEETDIRGEWTRLPQMPWFRYVEEAAIGLFPLS